MITQTCITQTFLLASSLLLPAEHPKVVFQAEDKVGKNQMVFDADTGTERVTGVSNDVRWSMEFVPGAIRSTLKTRIVISVKSLQTSDRKHTVQLRSSKWLHMEKYPTIEMAIDKVKKMKKRKPQGWNLECEAQITVRGVSRKATVPLQLVYLRESSKTKKRAPGSLVQMIGEFEVPMSTLGPEGRPGKIVTVKARLYGSTVPSTGKPGGVKPAKQLERPGGRTRHR